MIETLVWLFIVGYLAWLGYLGLCAISISLQPNTPKPNEAPQTHEAPEPAPKVLAPGEWELLPEADDPRIRALLAAEKEENNRLAKERLRAVRQT